MLTVCTSLHNYSCHFASAFAGKIWFSIHTHGRKINFGFTLVGANLCRSINMDDFIWNELIVWGYELIYIWGTFFLHQVPKSQNVVSWVALGPCTNILYNECEKTVWGPWVMSVMSIFKKWHLFAYFKKWTILIENKLEKWASVASINAKLQELNVVYV